jgi:hypothetical protein
MQGPPSLIDGREDKPSTLRRTYPFLLSEDGRQSAGVVVYSEQFAAKEMGMDQAHFAALQTKHAGLDRRISEEAQRPLPDPALLAQLKKEKLRLKEEMAGI